MPFENVISDKTHLNPVDFIGVGFGPTNISVAIALQEIRPELSAIFFEAQPSFGWHKGLLLSGATMQVSFLKDLVSFRNPRSQFSFTSFLHERGRLADFANLKTFFPSRIEFHQYLEWCAQNFAQQVYYGERVEEISFMDEQGGSVPGFRLLIAGKEGKRRVCARNVIFAGGLMPQMPPGLRGQRGVFHTSELLSNISHLRPGSRIAVVGAGQSATEAANYIYDNVPGSVVHAIVPRFGHSPADDSPFVNQVFDPEHVESFFNAPSQVKEKILSIHASTNYAAVDLADIEAFYQKWYSDRLTGEGRLHLHRMARLIKVTETGGSVVATINHELEAKTSELELDAVICATGYRPRDVRDLMDDRTRAALLTNEHGSLQADRLYRIGFDIPQPPALYIPDMCEKTHGLSATLISNMAVRAGEIVESLPDHRNTNLPLPEVA
ncbi:lysine N(6)-hydroxylase/L-ornithine N(5)-oxygenase family protein [Allorhizobium undicola]|uniref:lysine N(6)-hydroxylase/L-ornithine N(5)-oxygenase family protein n=1 Tax=Allorhizobium undicola TaxID=78527 RepID=UPI003D330706